MKLTKKTKPGLISYMIYVIIILTSLLLYNKGYISDSIHLGFISVMFALCMCYLYLNNNKQRSDSE